MIVWIAGRRYKGLLVLCLFIVIGSGIYWNSLGNPFQYDDQKSVELNRNIRTLKNLPYFFVKPRMLAANPYETEHYRPLVLSSFAVNYAVGGLNTTGYHIWNLAFHAGSAFLVFLIVQALLHQADGLPTRDGGKNSAGMDNGAAWASLAAGLIFLVHPFNSEVVNYITARSSVMSGFFYLLGFYGWVRFRNDQLSHPYVYYLISILAFISGMLCKEVVITLPFLLWLYDIYFRKTPHSTPRTMLDWRTYLTYLPFVVIVVIPYLAFRAASFGSVLPGFKRDMVTQLFTSLPVLVRHWKMFLFPAGLSPVHHVEIHSSFWSFPVTSSALFLTGYIVIALLLLRPSSHLCSVVSFFMLWFFIVLLPVTIIPLNAIFQENRGYLAAVSFAVLAGVIISVLDKMGFRKAGAVSLVFLVAIYSLLVFQRNSVWRDDLTLWSDTVQKAPQSPLGHTALGVAYQTLGMYNDAFEAYRKALILGGENNFIVHDNMARVYMKRKEWGMAAQSFEKAIRAFRFKAETHHDLAVAYFRMDQFDLSEMHFKEAARLNPEYYKTYYNLGVLYMKKGMKDKAAEQYRIVAEQAGDDEKELSLEAGRRLESLK